MFLEYFKYAFSNDFLHAVLWFLGDAFLALLHVILDVLRVVLDVSIVDLAILSPDDFVDLVRALRNRSCHLTYGAGRVARK